MPRDLSLAAMQALLAQQTGEQFCTCITIRHDDLEEPLRYVADHVALVRDAGTFIPLPFEIALPADQEDQIPTAQLVIDNIGRQLTATLRSIAIPPTVTLEVVLRSSPNIVEVGPIDFRLNVAEYDAIAVTGTLGFEFDVLNTVWPGDNFDPTNADA